MLASGQCVSLFCVSDQPTTNQPAASIEMQLHLKTLINIMFRGKGVRERTMAPLTAFTALTNFAEALRFVKTIVRSKSNIECCSFPSGAGEGKQETPQQPCGSWLNSVDATSCPHLFCREKKKFFASMKNYFKIRCRSTGFIILISTR